GGGARVAVGAVDDRVVAGHAARVLGGAVVDTPLVRALLEAHDEAFARLIAEARVELVAALAARGVHRAVEALLAVRLRDRLVHVLRDERVLVLDARVVAGLRAVLVALGHDADDALRAAGADHE